VLEILLKSVLVDSLDQCRKCCVRGLTRLVSNNNDVEFVPIGKEGSFNWGRNMERVFDGIAGDTSGELVVRIGVGG